MISRLHLLLGIFASLFIMAGSAQAQRGAQVYVDPSDAIRKVRIPTEDAVTGQGIQWALTASGRIVAYNSSRELDTNDDSPTYKLYPFVQWGTTSTQDYPENPVDPYGFIFQEVIDENGDLRVQRTAFKWKDYEFVVQLSKDMIENLILNQTVINTNDDGQPLVNATVGGTTITYLIEPNRAELVSARESGEAPIALTSATILGAASKLLGQGGANAGGGPAGPNQIDWVEAASEWYFYYDQMYMWQKYIEQEILDTDLGDDGLLELVPNELSARAPLFYNEILETRDRIADDEAEDNKRFYAELEQRRLAREDYEEYLEREKQELIEFAERQRREITGTEVEIENQTFMVVSEGLYQPPEGAVEIVTESGLITPYDILTGDGEVKTPYKVE